jgi:pyruvate,orthophosphate dikinase
LNASPGAAVGRAVFTADDAVAWTERGERVVLVRVETSPDDFHGMAVAEAIFTARGGATSHAAVVSADRQTRRGCAELVVDAGKRALDETGLEIGEGTGSAWMAAAAGCSSAVSTVSALPGSAALHTLLSWADNSAPRDLANADAREAMKAHLRRAGPALPHGICSARAIGCRSCGARFSPRR